MGQELADRYIHTIAIEMAWGIGLVLSHLEGRKKWNEYFGGPKATLL